MTSQTDSLPSAQDPETTVPTNVAIAADDVQTITMPFGPGWVTLDTRTGSPLQITAEDAPERAYLLDSDVPWHSLEHAWGAGYAITDSGTGRWNAPLDISITSDTVRTRHEVTRDLELEVERHSGAEWVERYRFINRGQAQINIRSLAIQTPFADVYPSARDALLKRVHAHIFTGGSWAFAAAQPMNGDGPVLGLRLSEGELWGYSVETRNANSISNARGHLLLHATDLARAESAFGGQPTISIGPGEQYVLSWSLAWYPTMEHFMTATQAPAKFSAFSATVGDQIAVDTDLVVAAHCELTVEQVPGGATLTASRPGVYWVTIDGSARTEVLFHDTVESTVRARAAFIMAHQRSKDRPGLLAHAFVPVDTSTLLPQTANGWSDWSDGSERIGIAIMLEQALAMGWVDDSVEVALDQWAAFAQRYLIDNTAAPRRGSQNQHAGVRLYDTPWLARFFLLRYGRNGNSNDLDLAAALLERAMELGISRFLTIGFSEIMYDVAEALSGDGQLARAQELRAALVACARTFVQLGTDLPGHEVQYEQSMVAPLLNLLTDAYRVSGDESLLDEIRIRLPWLLAFGAPLPHARLYGIAIRHWDGYWFGRDRQWGDVFPHYWSTLTATVLLRLPAQLRTPELMQLGEAILRANMANYFPDGSATCAFVMPTSVDGQPAHRADPMANDQDFHLALWLQLHAEGVVDLA